MKMMYNGTQIKSLNIKHYEMNTNSATVQPSDLQAGVTCFGRGKKITGTGKSFEFANYGLVSTNANHYVPSNINVVEVASMIYPIRLTLELNQMKNTDFTAEQKIAVVVIDGTEYDLKVICQSNFLKIICEKTIDLQVFYGKDNYTT